MNAFLISEMGEKVLLGPQVRWLELLMNLDDFFSSVLLFCFNQNILGQKTNNLCT